MATVMRDWSPNWRAAWGEWPIPDYEGITGPIIGAQDLFQATSGDWVIDIGWDRRHGSYVCTLVQNEDWESPKQFERIQRAEDAMKWALVRAEELDRIGLSGKA